LNSAHNITAGKLTRKNIHILHSVRSRSTALTVFARLFTHEWVLRAFCAFLISFNKRISHLTLSISHKKRVSWTKNKIRNLNDLNWNLLFIMCSPRWWTRRRLQHYVTAPYLIVLMCDFGETRLGFPWEGYAYSSFNINIIMKGIFVSGVVPGVLHGVYQILLLLSVLYMKLLFGSPSERGFCFMYVTSFSIYQLKNTDSLVKRDDL